MTAIIRTIREYIASEGHNGFRDELKAAVFLGACCVIVAVGVAALGVN